MRELNEEYSIKAQRVFLLGKYLMEDKWQRQLCLVYWMKTAETPKISGESTELKLASFVEVEKLILAGKAPEHYANDLKFLREKNLF